MTPREREKGAASIAFDSSSARAFRKNSKSLSLSPPKPPSPRTCQLRRRVHGELDVFSSRRNRGGRREGFSCRGGDGQQQEQREKEPQSHLEVRELSLDIRGRPLPFRSKKKKQKNSLTLSLISAASLFSQPLATMRILASSRGTSSALPAASMPAQSQRAVVPKAAPNANARTTEAAGVDAVGVAPSSETSSAQRRALAAAGLAASLIMVRREDRDLSTDGP